MPSSAEPAPEGAGESSSSDFDAPGAQLSGAPSSLPRVGGQPPAPEPEPSGLDPSARDDSSPPPDAAPGFAPAEPSEVELRVEARAGDPQVELGEGEPQVEGNAEVEASEGSREDPAEALESTSATFASSGQHPLRGALRAHLAVVARVTGRLGLAEAERAHDHLAESALWLALANLDRELGEFLQTWLAGEAWEHLVPGAGATPELQRLALGLQLLGAARSPGAPASARVLAALAAVALGTADPPTGRGLQPACADLDLLPLTEQVPVALAIRALVFEFRHLDLRQAPEPRFVAQIEDLLDRLDRTELLALRLSDHPALRRDEDYTWWCALVGSRSPQLVGLAQLALGHEAPPDRPTLLAALAARDPSWSEAGAALRLERLSLLLAERLGESPLAARLRAL